MSLGWNKGPCHYFWKTYGVICSNSNPPVQHPTSRTKKTGLYAKILFGSWLFGIWGVFSYRNTAMKGNQLPKIAHE